MTGSAHSVPRKFCFFRFEMNKNDKFYAESIILANSYVKCNFFFDYSTKSTDLSFSLEFISHFATYRKCCCVARGRGVTKFRCGGNVTYKSDRMILVENLLNFLIKRLS